MWSVRWTTPGGCDHQSDGPRLVCGPPLWIEHVQNEVHACILPRLSGLWAEEIFSFLFTPFEDFSTASICCNRSTTNLFIISFLNTRLFPFFLNLWIYLWLAFFCKPYGFICGWPRPVSSRSAKQRGWKSPHIVTIISNLLSWPAAVSVKVTDR